MHENTLPRRKFRLDAERRSGGVGGGRPILPESRLGGIYVLAFVGKISRSVGG